MRSEVRYFMICLLLLPLPSLSFAADGDLDMTFGSAGIVTTDVGGADDRAYSLAIQPDGKILLSGYSNSGSNYDFSLTRYHIDGSLDTSFNSTGIVTTDIANLDDEAHSVTLQPDGKILVGGSSEFNYHSQMALLRYNSDGSLDTSFNSTGIVTTDIGSSHEYAQSVTLQPDGKILLGGYSNNGSNNDFALARYNSDGSLDTSFNSTGIVTSDIGGANDLARCVAIQPDGHILLAGYSHTGGNNDMALIRYNSDGSLDTSFNSTGIITTNVGTGDNAYSAAIQPGPDGKILVGGYSYIDNYSQITLLRYNSDGSLDTSFNSTGIVTTDVGALNDYALSIAIQFDGKILVGGYSSNGSKNDMALLRYNSDGSLDTSFNSTGIVTTNVGGLNDGAYSVAIQPDGNILLAGYSNIGGNTDFALVRYQGPAVSEHTVTPSAGPGGSLNPSVAQLITYGETTSFTATPAAGHLLDSVSGCGGSLVGNIYTTAPVTADCTVTAAFAPITETLGVTVNGQGTVHSAPGIDIHCTDICTQDYNSDSIITLTATPISNYDFDGWTGDCTGPDDCIVTMDAAKSITATFTVNNIPYPVMLESTQVTDMTIQSAYDSIPAGQTDTIMVKAGEQTPENLMLDRDVTVKIEGGYDAIFSHIISDTLLYGTLTITGDPVTVSGLIIK